MKRIIFILIFLFLFSVPSYASSLVLQEYTLDTKALSPGRESIMTVKFKSNEDIKNIKIRFASTEIIPSGKDFICIDKSSKGRTFLWTTGLNVNSDVKSGKYQASLAAEYETDKGEKQESTDNITFTVSNENNFLSPRLYPESYSFENSYITPDTSGKLNIKISNANKKSPAQNIKITLSEETGDIKIKGTGKSFIDKISDTHTIAADISCIYNASEGEHKINMLTEYEDGKGNSYTENDLIFLEVRQTEKLDVDGAYLPDKIISGQNTDIPFIFMNTGKAHLYNCKAEFSCEAFTASGVAFAGDLAPGEDKSVSAVIKTPEKTEGEITGSIIITYENAYGEISEQLIPVSTQSIIKTYEEQEEEEKNYWFIYLLLGLVAGAGAGVFIMWLIKDKKQRKEDNLRL